MEIQFAHGVEYSEESHNLIIAQNKKGWKMKHKKGCSKTHVSDHELCWGKGITEHVSIGKKCWECLASIYVPLGFRLTADYCLSSTMLWNGKIECSPSCDCKNKK